MKKLYYPSLFAFLLVFFYLLRRALIVEFIRQECITDFLIGSLLFSSVGFVE